jgi:RNA polymerase sigma-70 factor (ECF subfamily)
MFFKKEMSEEEMIQGCLNNDRRCQELLYKRYFNVIWSMCIKNIKNETDVTDIVNEGFLKVFLNISKYENRGNLEGWIRRVVYNTMVDHIRKNQKFTRYMIFEDHDASIQENNVQSLYENDILKEIDKLPETPKEVFKLYAIDGYNHQEIGNLLNINEATSRWYLSEARKRLRELLNKNLDIKYNVR